MLQYTNSHGVPANKQKLLHVKLYTSPTSGPPLQRSGCPSFGLVSICAPWPACTGWLPAHVRAPSRRLKPHQALQRLGRPPRLPTNPQINGIRKAQQQSTSSRTLKKAWMVTAATSSRENPSLHSCAYSSSSSFAADRASTSATRVS
jgi:hypothetical protein